MISPGEVSFINIPNFNIEELVRLLGPRIVQTSGENYAIAMHKEDPTDHSNRTTFFDWHSDGLYHPQPPRFVLLHCLDPGNGQIKTELADTKQILLNLSLKNLQTLSKLRSHYIGHGGNFAHPILTTDGMLLASRGYVSPLPEISLEFIPAIKDTNNALTELYENILSNAVKYTWHAGDTLIFDQYRYLHRRNSNVIDKNRKLIRMWFNE